jgi:DNA-binding NarL/FixJ family response regulator
MVHSGAPGVRGELQLRAAHREDHRRLRGLVAGAASIGPGGAMRLRSPDRQGRPTPTLAALICPVPARLGVAARASAPGALVKGFALVLLRDLAAPDAPSSRVLSELFDLTDTEAAVMLGLIGGRSAEQVALARGVTLDTVRSQIRAILWKTRASNLRDLERVSATLATMSRHEGDADVPPTFPVPPCKKERSTEPST